MSKLKDFSKDDRVHHIMIGDGTVERVDAEGVHVVFDSRRNKKPIRGIYDARWFQLNPVYLFHRSKKLERDEQASMKGTPKKG